MWGHGLFKHSFCMIYLCGVCLCRISEMMTADFFIDWSQPFKIVLMSSACSAILIIIILIFFKSATGRFNLTGHEKYIQIFYLESCLWRFRYSVNGNTGTSKFWLAKCFQAFHQIQWWKGLFERATHVLYLSRWPIFVQMYFRSGSVLKF